MFTEVQLHRSRVVEAVVAASQMKERFHREGVSDAAIHVNRVVASHSLYSTRVLLLMTKKMRNPLARKVRLHASFE